MPLLNFKAEFAEKVRSGEKRQTIRAFRKDGRDPKPGQTLYLYTGLRTITCKKLGEATCTDTAVIIIDRGTMYRNSFPLAEFEATAIAIADGFDNYSQFQGFFDKHYGLPFYGIIIFWGGLNNDRNRNYRGPEDDNQP
jgi:hypothetical protein